MNALVLKAPAKPVYQIASQNSHPRTSLRRVLWVKLLRWVDKASAYVLGKLVVHVLGALTIVYLVLAPLSAWTVLRSVIEWNGYRVPLLLATLLLVFRGKRLWLLCRRFRARKEAAGNQYLYRGLTIDGLATFLLERQSFKREEAMSTFAISQDKHHEIASELEHHGVLTRGPNNSRVLALITREELVRQLRDGFPLAFHNGAWTEKTGSYHLFLQDEEKRAQKQRDQLERQERKKKRLQQEIAKLSDSPFQVHELAM